MDLYITIFILFISSYYIDYEKLRMDRANIFLNEQEYNFKLINILRWKLKYENNPKEGRIRDWGENLSLSYTHTQRIKW